MFTGKPQLRWKSEIEGIPGRAGSAYEVKYLEME